MRKFVVISVNENPEYQFYIPLVMWAWRHFGWEPIIQCVNVDTRVVKLWFDVFDKLHEGITAEMKFHYSMKGMDFTVPPGYRSDTVAQTARLYAACVIHNDDYIMTSDADMLPLSDYWKFDPEKITVWGHDLTGYQHMPICYIGMKSSRWREVMGIVNNDHNAILKRDLDVIPNAKSEDQVKRWVVDQDLITERINNVQFDKEFVHRGVYSNGYPVGRIDRSAWEISYGSNIDCHMPRVLNNPGGFSQIAQVLMRVWPSEDFNWFAKYTEEFFKLVK